MSNGESVLGNMSSFTTQLNESMSNGESMLENMTSFTHN